MRLTRGTLAGLLGGALLTSVRSVPAAAMSLPPAVPRSVVNRAIFLPDTTLAAQLATITTDTGAFAPGRKDFTRYDSPALCLGAAEMAKWQVKQKLPTVWDDSIGLGAAAQVARACGARFTLATTAPTDRPLLYKLALFAQRDSVAEAIAAVLLAPAGPGAARDTANRDTLQFQLMRQALDAGRAAVAETLLARLARAGPAAQSLYQWLLGLWLGDEGYRMNPDGTRWAAHLSAARRRWAAEEEIRWGTQPARRTDEWAYWRVSAGYSALLEEAAFQSRDSVLSVAHRAQHDLASFPRVLVNSWNTSTHPADGILERSKDWAAEPLDSVIAKKIPYYMGFEQLSGGIPAPRLHADYWFPAPGQPASDTIWPVPGKVNLLCSGAKVMDNGSYELGADEENIRRSDAQQAADIQRWVKVYGPAGLVVALVRPAAGHDYFGFGNAVRHSDFGVLENVMPPAMEAQAWRWLEQDYLHVPATLAVQVRHSTFGPEPDGRRWTTTRLQWNQFMWPHFLRLGIDYCDSTGKIGGNDCIPTDTLPQDTLSRYRPGEGQGGATNHVCVVIDRAGKFLADASATTLGWGGSSMMIDRILRWVFAEAGRGGVHMTGGAPAGDPAPAPSSAPPTAREGPAPLPAAPTAPHVGVIQPSSSLTVQTLLRSP